MRETIYILGLEVPSKLGERPPPVGEDVDVAIKVNNLPSIWMTIFPQEMISPAEDAQDLISIFGFGHDGYGKWTFAGRR